MRAKVRRRFVMLGVALALLVNAAPTRAAFTEFYCNASTGSNMNGGSDAGTSPSYTATNGGWNSGTGVFTPTSGNPSSSVTVGQFASVFTDGATTPVFIGRVTAVNSTTVTVSTTAKSGTAPTTAGTGISINVGGVWKGPNAAVSFPFGFITTTLISSTATSYPRVNLKNGTTYSVTAAVTGAGANGPLVFQGYTTTIGDGGRFTLDGGTSGASYALLTLTHNTWLADAIIQNNGATGSASGLTMTGNACLASNVTVQNVRGNGFEYTGGQGVFVECEATGCNQSNTASKGGFVLGNVVTTARCVAHDNTGSNTIGFLFTGLQSNVHHCVADSNGGRGFFISNGHAGYVANCDSYNNGSDGFYVDQAANSYATYENCNAVKNGGWGFNNNNSGVKYGFIRNCGVGSGSQANTSGDINTGAAELGLTVVNKVTYASGATPWNDPANGDFTITLGTAKAAGRGAFLGTTSTTGYPDIGAAQSRGGGLSRARIVNQ